jgi:hypothetical protein
MIGMIPQTGSAEIVTIDMKEIAGAAIIPTTATDLIPATETASTALWERMTTTVIMTDSGTTKISAMTATATGQKDGTIPKTNSADGMTTAGGMKEAIGSVGTDLTGAASIEEDAALMKD